MYVYICEADSKSPMVLVAQPALKQVSRRTIRCENRGSQLATGRFVDLTFQASRPGDQELQKIGSYARKKHETTY